MVLASAAAGLVAPIGAVSTEIRDLERLRESTTALRRLGFPGSGLPASGSGPGGERPSSPRRPGSGISGASVAEMDEDPAGVLWVLLHPVVERFDLFLVEEA